MEAHRLNHNKHKTKKQEKGTLTLIHFSTSKLSLTDGADAGPWASVIPCAFCVSAFRSATLVPTQLGIPDTPRVGKLIPTSCDGEPCSFSPNHFCIRSFAEARRLCGVASEFETEEGGMGDEERAAADVTPDVADGGGAPAMGLGEYVPYLRSCTYLRAVLGMHRGGEHGTEFGSQNHNRKVAKPSWQTHQQCVWLTQAVGPISPSSFSIAATGTALQQTMQDLFNVCKCRLLAEFGPMICYRALDW